MFLVVLPQNGTNNIQCNRMLLGVNVQRQTLFLKHFKASICDVRKSIMKPYSETSCNLMSNPQLEKLRMSIFLGIHKNNYMGKIKCTIYLYMSICDVYCCRVDFLFLDMLSVTVGKLSVGII